jgi:hypothetical protein
LDGKEIEKAIDFVDVAVVVYLAELVCGKEKWK